MNDLTAAPPTAIVLPLPDARLQGELALPRGATGLVVFVHGSGSSRFSPRNRLVAQHFNALGLGTLLFDLLTAQEHRVDEMTREFRFDIPLLAGRMVQVIDWLAAERSLHALRLGLFGASTGAAAALIAAAERPERVSSVVARGGRTDLAGDATARVRAPTLLLAGARDETILALNRDTARALAAPHQLVKVPGASHLFEEPGTLEQVASIAGQWFLQHLR